MAERSTADRIREILGDPPEPPVQEEEEHEYEHDYDEEYEEYEDPEPEPDPPPKFEYTLTLTCQAENAEDDESDLRDQLEDLFNEHEWILNYKVVKVEQKA